MVVMGPRQSELESWIAGGLFKLLDRFPPERPKQVAAGHHHTSFLSGCQATRILPIMSVRTDPSPQRTAEFLQTGPESHAFCFVQ